MAFQDISFVKPPLRAADTPQRILFISPMQLLYKSIGIDLDPQFQIYKILYNDVSCPKIQPVDLEFTKQRIVNFKFYES